jgi:hypothetical protein
MLNSSPGMLLSAFHVAGDSGTGAAVQLSLYPIEPHAIRARRTYLKGDLYLQG